MSDPIVDEVRKYRDEHAKSFNYDLKAFCDDFKSKHEMYVKKLKDIKEDLSRKSGEAS